MAAAAAAKNGKARTRSRRAADAEMPEKIRERMGRAESKSDRAARAAVEATPPDAPAKRPRRRKGRSRGAGRSGQAAAVPMPTATAPAPATGPPAAGPAAARPVAQRILSVYPVARADGGLDFEGLTSADRDTLRMFVGTTEGVSLSLLIARAAFSGWDLYVATAGKPV